MKKAIAFTFLALVILINAVACDGVGIGFIQGGDLTTGQPQGAGTFQTTFDLLNELADQRYGRVSLDILTKTGDVTLEARYTLTDSEVTYSVEQLRLLPDVGQAENGFSDDKVTLNGKASVENGVVTKMDDDNVSVPSYNELKGSFDFKESNFKNIQRENGKITAEVLSVSDFLGIDKELYDLKIAVEYNDTALQKITLTYRTTHATVTAVYGFEPNCCL